MFKSFRGREISLGQKVKVYKNLRNGLWSLKDAKTNLVLGHIESVELQQATFVVGESGRQQVIREKVKNVHAYIVGHYNGSYLPIEEEEFNFKDVTYNPYKESHFTLRSDRSVILKVASRVVLDSGNKGVYMTL